MTQRDSDDDRPVGSTGLELAYAVKTAPDAGAVNIRAEIHVLYRSHVDLQDVLRELFRAYVEAVGIVQDRAEREDQAKGLGDG